MATLLQPNQGKQWIGINPISSAQLWMMLCKTKTISAGNITALSTMGNFTEATGTGYVRQAVALGTMNAIGSLRVPAVTWKSANGTDWPTDVTGQALCTSSTIGQGTVVYAWDYTGGTPPYNMAGVGATVAAPAVDWFFYNPGEA